MPAFVPISSRCCSLVHYTVTINGVCKAAVLLFMLVSLCSLTGAKAQFAVLVHVACFYTTTWPWQAYTIIYYIRRHCRQTDDTNYYYRCSYSCKPWWQITLNREPDTWIMNYIFHSYLINVLCDFISISATNRCMFVISVRGDSPISDCVQWNAMHELRTAAMQAKLFWIILHKVMVIFLIGKLGYCKSDEWGKRTTLDGSVETTINLRLFDQFL